MTQSEKSFIGFLDKPPGTQIEQGNFFGFQALKHQGKSFVILSGEQLIFRLDDDLRKEALLLAGSSLWNPYGREKRNWVQLSSEHMDKWTHFFEQALHHVGKP